ncbi:MAG TPA: histidine kinase [Thermoanaerobaculia bacterium]|nr:histidine kinase [Thermoanaerobaculia bacterium]
MASQRFPQSRAERLIAIGRFVLALAAFGAMYLDPLEPAQSPALTHALLVVYGVYALAVVLWNVAASSTTRRILLATHVFDLVFFGVINATAFGPTAPFFVFFVFSISCAMLRFGRRGTVLTAGSAVMVYIASSIAGAASTPFELNRFAIRVTYLVVLASMLIYLATYQERIQHDLQRIARWPRSARRDHETLLAQLLSEAALIFGARRVLLAYKHLSERSAWLYAGNALEAQPPETAKLLLERDSGTYFSSAAYPAVRIDAEESVVQRPQGRIPEEIVRQYGVDAVIATSIRGDFVRGTMLLLDGPSPLLEEINLARIAGTVVAGRLDHYHAAQQLQRGAVAEERVRVARDLHDSVLQSLTGVALQLHTLPRLMVRDPDEARKRLGEVEQVIGATQKELRWFIDELRPERSGRDDDAILGERLSSLAQRFREQWGLDVENEVAPVVHLLPIGTRYEIYAIVNEAVANAAKHAAAKRVAVHVDVDDNTVQIDVADDGKGFPWRGRHDLQSLVASNIGPVTLKERVSSLGGSMLIDSSARGAKLEIRMPLRGGA